MREVKMNETYKILTIKGAVKGNQALVLDAYSLSLAQPPQLGIARS